MNPSNQNIQQNNTNNSHLNNNSNQNENNSSINIITQPQNIQNNEISDDNLNEIYNINNQITMIRIGNLQVQKHYAKELGQIFKEESTIMKELRNKKLEREKLKKVKDITLFFNQNNDIYPITAKSYKTLIEIFWQYHEETNQRGKNLKFIFKGREFPISEFRLSLYEIKGLVNGEEIIVVG